MGNGSSKLEKSLVRLFQGDINKIDILKTQFMHQFGHPEETDGTMKSAHSHK